MAGDTRLRLARNPLRLAVSASPWRGGWYLAGYVLATGWLLFAVSVTAVTTALGFAVTLAGIPLLLAAAAVLRGCAGVERHRLRQVLDEPVRGGYQQVIRPGIAAEVSTRWRDRATWHDVAYLIGLWVPLYIVDTVVLSVWIMLLAGISLPAWYWAPRGNAGIGYVSGPRAHGVALGYFPHGPDGPGGAGLYVDTLPKALLAAACFLVLFLAFNYVLVITARAHARVARAVLRAPADPLADAKEVLARPGPLGSVRSHAPNGG